MTEYETVTIEAYVSGYKIKDVIYVNADQLALAFHAAGEPRAAAIVQTYAAGIRKTAR